MSKAAATHAPEAEPVVEAAIREIITLTKITIATVNASPILIKREDCTSEPLVRIAGIARSLKPGVNKTTGESHTALVGEFAATNLSTGQEYTSGLCYLPSGIQDTINSAIQDGQTNIEFCIELRAVKAKNPAGYSYQAVPLTQVAAASPLDKFKKFLTPGPVRPQLAAPAA
jgi:hypothetical protein